MIYQLIFILFLTLAAGGARAGELSLLGGLIQELRTPDSSYGWQLDYAWSGMENFKYSVSYLNEGHASVNHRDGVSAQIRPARVTIGRAFGLWAGLGPYYYFDTHTASIPAENKHGWGDIVTLGADWHRRDNRWFFQFRTNWISTREQNTRSSFLGIGYSIGPPVSRVEITDEHPVPEKFTRTKNEITVFLGEDIVNNPDRTGHYSHAESLEYRNNIRPNIDWTAGWLNENKNNLTDRKGFITQIWAVSSYHDDRVTVGFGVGPYIAQDRLRDQNSDKIFMSGAVSFTSAYRFGRVWDARFSWSRIITDYHRDSDVIMLGLGYRY